VFNWKQPSSWCGASAAGLVTFGFAASADPAFAQERTGTINPGDTAWVMISAALVFLMTPGLAFFYGGLVRTKNVLATLMHSFIALGVVSLVWLVIAYSLAFAPNNGLIGGFQWAFLSGVTAKPNPDYGATIPHNLFMIFQCMFAIITPAVVSGAYAERVKFKSHVLFLILWTVAIYAPLAHWVWGVDGFLKVRGVLDFGGGLVIHIAAGASAIAAALMFGPRKDYGSSIAPGNIPYVVLGAALLWFGWFGFNGGSAIMANEVAATAFINTHMAAAAAMMSWVFVDWLVRGKPSVVGACVGCLLGMIALSPACGFVSTQSAVLIGLVSGAAGNIVASLRLRTRIDDSLDVFACHGVGIHRDSRYGLICFQGNKPGRGGRRHDAFLAAVGSCRPGLLILFRGYDRDPEAACPHSWAAPN
jgi:Amt family ammonium transporter